jgi:peptide/nickel transport system permease protein
MTAYIARRLLQAIPSLLIITVLVFLLIQFAPGDPLARYTEFGTMSPEAIARMRHQLGLDQPLYVQYIKWLTNWVRGDWGRSLSGLTPVRELIVYYVRNSIVLAGISLVVGLIVGVLVGIISALKEYTWVDSILRAFSFFGLCAPVYWVGLMMIMLFSVKLGWLPGGGMLPLAEEPTFAGRLKHLVMPVIAGSLFSIGVYARYTRSCVLEVMTADYVRTARGKGLGERTVLLRHILRNALLPMVTVVALRIPWILSGSVLVEAIFSWPGMGRQYWVATMEKDIPVIMSMFTLISVAVVLTNLLADIVYCLVDPRITFKDKPT